MPAPREETFLLARSEARVLEWIARRTPARVTPDHMTALGVLAAFGIAYLVLSINTYLETQAFGVFSLGYGRLGPTEARLGLIALNTAPALGLGTEATVAGLGVSPFDAIGVGAVAVMLGGVAWRAARNLRVLAEREPYAA